MSAHTPGPWTVEGPFKHGTAESRFEVISEPFNVTIALCVYGRGDSEAEATARADAEAIAAAPDLLAALDEAEHCLVRAFGEPPDSAAETNMGHRGIRQARAAIAKARGSK